MNTTELLNYPDLTETEIHNALQAAIHQTESCLKDFSDHFKNIYSDHGFYKEAPNDQWTNGFWTGELWLAYENSKDERFKKAALNQVSSFMDRITNEIETDTHDLGFLYSLSCVAGYKLTKDPVAKKAALMAADKLKSRFHEKGQFLQAWGSMDDPLNYRLIIDCLLNLPLLYWAAEETGNEDYEIIAHAHLETALKVIVRPDHSTYHTYYFHPESGVPLKGVTHQGYSADSAWSRGQSWAVYGIALSYKYTKNPDYIRLFEQVTDYFITHLPKNLIPYWDFIFEDGSEEPWDSSASAIAVCGMLEMSKYLPSQKAGLYTDIARRMMKALIDHCAVTSPAHSNGQLLHGVYGRKTPYNDCIDHGIDECNLWGDYYYVEALTRLSKDWVLYW